ncbi:sensor histidine kinase [Streptomyces triticagri]|uniref:Oxygen sensor histidine kinase NreB n=2 Tax=Streptomyces triticagri TaxID=2293568 RepID=A0A372MBF5_9ACTN|nr:sensor histidine kinase [Streptomyces triticagri]
MSAAPGEGSTHTARDGGVPDNTGDSTGRGEGLRNSDLTHALAERWAWFFRWGPLCLLAVGTFLAVATTGDLHPLSRWLLLTPTICATLVLQLWWNRRTRAPQPLLAQPGAVAGQVYFWLRAALALALTSMNGFYGVFAVIGYFDAGRLLPGSVRTRAGLLGTAVIMAWSNMGGKPAEDVTGWVAFGGLLTLHCGLALFFGHIGAKEIEEAEERAATITELERTNARLEAALAENAGLHAQLLVQAREAGVADERRRLAAEIHDTLAQGLTGIIAQLQVVAATEDRRLAREHVDRAADLARHSLGEARRSVQNLSPVALATGSLPDALQKTVARWGERTGVQAQFTATGRAAPLHEEVEATLLRIAQEALSNIGRHAGAARAGVTLSYMDDEVALDIRDDGRGFDPAAPVARTGTGGFGLDGIRARAERVAGSVEIESEPGAGTAISARVPWVPHD